MTESDVIARSRVEFLDAFNRNDVEGLAALLTDDHVGMPPNRPALAGKEASRAYWQQGIAVAQSQFSISSYQLEVVGDIAIDEFHWVVDSAPRAGGGPVHDEGKCIWIWRRQSDGAWKIARAIWNSDLAIAGVWSGATT